MEFTILKIERLDDESLTFKRSIAIDGARRKAGRPVVQFLV